MAVMDERPDDPSQQLRDGYRQHEDVTQEQEERALASIYALAIRKAEEKDE